MFKKLLPIVMLVFVTACAQTDNMGMTDKGMMCEKCACCQKMMKDGMEMADMIKYGTQCPMMQGDKAGKSCGCCQGMVEGGMKMDGMQCPMMKDGKSCSCCEKMMKNKSTKPAAKKTVSKPSGVNNEDHKQHHPAQ